MKNAGKACNNRLYRHIRTFEKIVKNYFVISTKYAKIHVLHRVALLILLILPLANKGFLWYALSTERVSPMKS